MNTFKCWMILGTVTMMVIITSNFVYGSESQQKEYTILSDLIEQGLVNNNDVQAKYHAWQASIAQARQATALSDPMLKYTYFGESVQTRVGPQEHKYGLSQKIPFPFKRHLKAKAGQAKAEMLKQQYEEARRGLTRDIKQTYADLYKVEQNIKLTENEKDLLKNIEAVVRKKYEANLVGQQDVLKAQVELGILEQKIVMLRQQRSILKAKMNRLLNRDPQIVVNVDIVDYPTLTVSLDQLLTTAEKYRPKVLMQTAAVEQAHKETLLARTNFLPDFTLGMEYIEIGSGTTSNIDDGQDAWMASITVNMPIWFDRLNAQLKEKHQQELSALSQQKDITQDVALQVQQAYFNADGYADIMNLYKHILIPQSRHAFEAVQKGYEAGQVDFLNWLDAQRRYLQTRMAFYQAQADYARTLADLEFSIGRNIEEVES